MRTPTKKETQNKEWTVQSEKVQCVKVDTPTLGYQKAWKCAKTMDSEGKIESRNLRRVTVTRTHTHMQKSTKLQRSSWFVVLGADVIVDRDHHELSLKRGSAKDQEETEIWCTKVTKKHADHARPVSRTWTWRSDGERT